MAFRLIDLSHMSGPAIFTVEEATKMFCVSITAGSFRTMEKFAFIDFLIVRNVNDSFLSDLIIEDYKHPKAHMIGGADHRAKSRHRDILARQRLLRTTKSAALTGPGLMTIILEVVRANSFCIGVTSFMPRRQAETPHNTLAVVYKRRLGLEPQSQGFNLHLETSIPIFLNSRIFDYTPRIRAARLNPWNQPPDVPPMLLAITLLSVGQVLPKRFPSLSPCIFRTIALLVIDLGHPKPYWRQQLLALGLISKSWSIVLDLFFEVHCPGECRSSLLSMASALSNARPQRALLMRKFSLDNYYETMNPHTKPAILAAMKFVLRLARNIKEIQFALEFLKDQDIMNALGCLRFLDTARMGSFLDTTHLTSVPILQAVFVWPSLTTFAANGPRNRGGDRFRENRFAPDARTDTRLPCSLSELSLMEWSINGPIFAKFFNVVRPRMERLYLVNVLGLRNLDLYNGLKIMANSLIEIVIINCEIQKGEVEEHAIDTLISQFPLLTRLGVSSKHISYRTVERRARQPDNTITSLSIYQIKGAASFFKRFPRALECSPGAWKTISIFSSGFLTEEDMDAIDLTRVACDEIGVQVLYLHGMDPYTTFY